MYSVVLGWEEDMVVDSEDARMQLQVPNAGCRGSSHGHMTGMFMSWGLY